MNSPSREAFLSILDTQHHLMAAGAESHNPFAELAWLRLFVNWFADDRQLGAVAIQADVDGHAALMPLARDPRHPWRLQALSNYYSSLYSPIYTLAPDRSQAARALVQCIRKEHKESSIVQLAPLSSDGVDTAALRDAFGADGWYTRDYFCFGNWYLPCEGMNFNDYMKGRESQVYNTWTRKAKKFKTDGTGEARLQVVREPDDVKAGMAAYEAVYQKSWKQAEPFPDFIREWAAVCAQHGWLRLGVAWLGDTPIAAQLWFTINRRAYIFKLAYDEAYSKWSAGTVLTAHLMRESLDQDRVIEIDYLTGDDAYKKSWMSHRRERVGLLACNLRTPRGLAMAAREGAAATVRRWFPARGTPTQGTAVTTP